MQCGQASGGRLSPRLRPALEDSSSGGYRTRGLTLLDCPALLPYYRPLAASYFRLLKQRPRRPGARLTVKL
eukprot:402650-Hanusia_phi.AAC.1